MLPSTAPVRAPAKRLIGVVLGDSAASPTEISAGLAALGEPMFIVDEKDQDSAALLPVLEALGRVIKVNLGDAAHSASFVGAQRPDAVLTFSEQKLRAASDLASSLGVPFHSPTTTSALTDKYLQRTRLRDAGVDVTRTWLLRGPSDWDAAVASVGVPAVLKPVQGDSSRSTFRIDDEEEGRRRLGEVFRANSRCGPFVLEELLRGANYQPLGDYVSVESVVSDGVATHVAVTGKYPLEPPFREVGHFFPSGLDSLLEADVRELTTRALQALGVDGGITHTEVKLTETGPRVIEVNGRLGGFIGDLVLRAGGPNLVEVAARLALGERPDCAPLERHGVVFQYSNLAPIAGGRLRHVRGLSEVRDLPEVDYVRRLIRRGAKLGADVGTVRLDLIGGKTPGHAELFELVARLKDSICYKWATDDELSSLASDASGAAE